MNTPKLAAIAAATVLSTAFSMGSYADKPTHSPVVFIPGGMEVPGAISTIQRNDSGFRVSIETNSLESKVYTMWIFAWHDAATHPNCGGAICTFPADCVMYGTGHLIGAAGKGTFSAHIGVGDTSPVRGGVSCGAGLENARTAAIHAAIADHGELDPSALPGAIQSGGPVVQGTAHEP